MAETNNHNDGWRETAARHEGDIATLKAGQQEIQQSIKELVTHFDKRFDQNERNAQPDKKLLAQWVSILLVIIGMVGGIIAYSLNDKISGVITRQQDAVAALSLAGTEREVKLWKELDRGDVRRESEAATLRENVKATALALKEDWREAATSLQGQIDRRMGNVEATQNAQTNRELDELARRRLSDDCAGKK